MMNQVLESFPGIKRIALLIARDNGMINRVETEEDFISRCDEIIGAEGVDYHGLVILDVWCMTLNDDEALTLAAGEEQDMQALIEKSPNPEICGIFEDIFNL